MKKLNHIKIFGKLYKLPKGFHSIENLFGYTVFNQRDENVTSQIMGNAKSTGYIINTDKGVEHLILMDKH